MLLCDAAAVIAFDFGGEISSADHALRDGAGHPIEIRRGSRGLERDDEPGLAGRAHGKINSDLIRPNLGTRPTVSIHGRGKSFAAPQGGMTSSTITVYGL
jgi:hypothetical protein